jgi:hypothetical protein
MSECNCVDTGHKQDCPLGKDLRIAAMQEQIAILETSLAERWESLNVQDGIIDGLQEEIAALRAAAIQPVMSRQGFGTPGTIECYRCVFCNLDARTPDIAQGSDCVTCAIAGHWGRWRRLSAAK